MLIDKKISFLDLLQWLILSCIVLGRYIEVGCLIIISILIILKKGRAYFPKSIIFASLIILVYSSISIYFLGYEPGKFIQQYFLLFVVVFGYLQLFSISKFHIYDLFQKYLVVCFVVSLVGLVQFAIAYFLKFDIIPYTLDGMPTQLFTGEGRMRLHSFFQEPGNLGYFLTSSIAYIILDNTFFRKNKMKSIVIFLCFLMTFATISYFLLILIFIIYLFRKFSYFKYILIGLLVIGSSAIMGIMKDNLANEDRSQYGFTQSMLMKFVETTTSIFSLENDPSAFEILNLSSYATLTNFWVSINAPNRFAGTGLGTHQSNYYSMYKSPSYYRYGINSEDGYSMFNRLYSEFGFVGLSIYVLFLYKNFNRKNLINLCALLAIISLLIRGGHYTQYGAIFFHFMYYYSSYNRQDMIINE